MQLPYHLLDFLSVKHITNLPLEVKKMFLEMKSMMNRLYLHCTMVIVLNIWMVAFVHGLYLPRLFRLFIMYVKVTI